MTRPYARRRGPTPADLAQSKGYFDALQRIDNSLDYIGAEGDAYVRGRIRGLELRLKFERYTGNTLSAAFRVWRRLAVVLPKAKERANKWPGDMEPSPCDSCISAPICGLWNLACYEYGRFIGRPTPPQHRYKCIPNGTLYDWYFMDVDLPQCARKGTRAFETAIRKTPDRRTESHAAQVG